MKNDIQTDTAGRADWKDFWLVISEPWTIGLLCSSIALLAVSQKALPPEANTLVQVLLAVSTGVLGGRIANRISKLTEESVLLARGKVSVRGLQLLLGTAAALEARVASFLAEPEEMDSHPRVIARNYQEIMAQCRQLQEETVSSIENWTDIVSEARTVTQIGHISRLKKLLEEKEAQLAELNATLSKIHQDEEVEKLTAEEQVERDYQVALARRQIADFLRSSAAYHGEKVKSSTKLYFRTDGSTPDGQNT